MVHSFNTALPNYQTDQKLKVEFAMSVDATKVSIALEISTGHGDIICG